MYAVSATRTMQSARPKFRQPEPDETRRVIYPREFAPRPKVETPDDVVRRKSEELALRILRRRREEADARAAAELRKLRREAGEEFWHTFEVIERRIIRATGVTKRELRSRRRHREISLARQAIMYWCARLTKLSYPHIGKLLGDIDHTTVMHGKRVYVNRRKAMGRTLKPVR